MTLTDVFGSEVASIGAVRVCGVRNDAATAE